MNTVVIRILFSLILAFPGSVLADFSGKYQGGGRQHDSDGLDIECLEASITIDHTKDKINLGTLIFKCGENVGIWEPIEFIIKGNDLYFQNKKVGNIENNILNAKIWDTKSNESEIIYMYIDNIKSLNLNRMWNDPSNRSWLNLDVNFKKPVTK